MTDSFNETSIKETLNVIKKALQEENDSPNEKVENVLILNQLVKDDGTIETIHDNNFEKEEIKKILNNKLSEVFEEHLEKWFDNNIPHYLDKHLPKNK